MPFCNLPFSFIILYSKSFKKSTSSSASCKNSTIFKTFENDLDKISAKWGIFGKSFNEIGQAIKGRITDVNNALSVTNDLTTSLKSSPSIFKRLFPSKESIKSQLIDVDSVIPKIDSKNFDFNKWITELNEIDKEVKAGTKSWQDYSNSLDENERWIAKWGQETEGQIRTQRDMVKANEAARQSALAHNVALKQQTLGAKAANVALKGLSLVGNMAASWAISKGIEIAIKAVDDFIHRIERIKEAAETAKKAIDDIKSEFESLSDKTDKVKQRFAELAQGVENLGKFNQFRGTLSIEDYAEFLDLSNQLAELYPQLTKGYDDNGNAILELSGDVNTITASLERLLDVQQRIANQEIMKNMPDVWAGYQVELDEYDKEIKRFEKYQDKIDSFLSLLSQGQTRISSGFNDDFSKPIKEAIKNAGLQDVIAETYVMARGAGKNNTSYTWDLSKLTDEQIEQLKRAFGRLKTEYQDTIEYTKGEIEAANSEVSSYINTWLSSASVEWRLDRLEPQMKNVVKDVLMNGDWAESLPDNVNSESWDEVSNWLEENFLYAISNIDNGEIKQSLYKAIDDTLSIDELQKIIEDLKTTEGFDENNPLVVYLQAKLNTKQERIDGAKAKLLPEYQSKVDELSDEDLQIASEQLSITDGTLLTWDELQQKIQEVKDEEKTAALVNKDYANSITKIKEAINGVLKNSKLFQDAIEKLKGGESLNYDEVIGLIELDPSIASDFQKTADGYSIAIQTLIDADKAYAQSKGAQIIEDSLNQTTTEIANAQSRIEQLQKRKTEIQDILFANRTNDHFDKNDYMSELIEIDNQIADLEETIGLATDATAALKIMLSELSGNAVSDAEKSFTDIVSDIEEVVSKLESLAKVYNDVKNGADFDWSSILNNEDFKKTFANCTETYDAFIKTIASSPDDINACQEAFDNLVGEYLATSGVLSELTEETKDAAIAMLGQNGIANAAEIVEAKLRQLAIAKENEANVSKLLAKNTLEEKEAFLKEIDMSKETAQALLDVLAAKIKLNATEIESEKDIDALIAIAEKAEIAKAEIDKLKQAKSVIGTEFNQGLYDRGEYLAKHGGFGVNNADDIRALQYYQAQLALMQVQAGNININPDVNFDGSTAEDSKINDKLQQKIDYYKSILDAVEAVKNKYAEAVDAEIDALNEGKEALKDANDERQRELDLIEARNNLENAKKRKVWVYSEGEGFKQISDEGAVKEAEEKLQNVVTEIQESEIDKQLEALQEQKEQLEKNTEALLNLEKDIQEAQGIAQALDALGLTDETDLLNLSPEVTEEIKTGLADAINQKKIEENKGNAQYTEISLDDFLNNIGAKVDASNISDLLSADTIRNTAAQAFADALKEQASNAVSNVVNNGGTNFTNTFNIYDATDPDKVAKIVNQEITNLFTKVNNSIK